MSILKNVVESMRDKERNAILEEDKRMAQNIFDRTKKAKTVDDEILTEKEEMKGIVMLRLDRFDLRIPWNCVCIFDQVATWQRDEAGSCQQSASPLI